MPRPPAGRPVAKELPGEKAAERVRIRSSMRRWREMDETASRLGRGLGREELITRVALETGASEQRVRSAIKS